MFNKHLFVFLVGLLVLPSIGGLAQANNEINYLCIDSNDFPWNITLYAGSTSARMTLGDTSLSCSYSSEKNSYTVVCSHGNAGKFEDFDTQRFIIDKNNPSSQSILEWIKDTAVTIRDNLNCSSTDPV